jgi:hypothetical protein
MPGRTFISYLNHKVRHIQQTQASMIEQVMQFKNPQILLARVCPFQKLGEPATMNQYSL